MAVLVAVLLLSGLVGLALAQDQEYALKDYMPQTVGSKWIMKVTGPAQQEVVLTYEVDKPKEGQPGTPILTKDANGNLTRGSLETVDDNNLTIFGTIRVPRGQQGGEPTVSLYTPAVVFPGKMKVSQRAEAATKINMGGQQTDVTMKLDLAAVESVTVPKGTFDNCLKLVFTTTNPRGEMKRTVWYAKGVGLVKTEMGGGGNQQAPRVAELTDYQLAQ
jgi:hypothetical protein